MPQVTAICAHVWAYAAREPEGDITPILGQVFTELKEAGFDAVELMSNVLANQDTVRRIEELSVAHKLPVIGCSFSGAMWDRSKHDKILQQAEQVLNALHRLGGQMLGVSTGAAPQGKKSEEQLDAQCELLDRLIRMAADRGVMLNLHNHTYEVLYGEHEVRENIRRLPYVKLGPDLNWLRRAGVDPLDFLRRYGDRVVFLHLRDQLGDHWVQALGDGDEDYVQLGWVLNEIKFRGPVAIELAHETDTKLTRTLAQNFAVSCRNLRIAWRM